MNKFNVGDKVIVTRNYTCNFKGEIADFVSNVCGFDEDGGYLYSHLYFVKKDGFYSNHDKCPFHEHELTHLVKKKKKSEHKTEISNP